MARAPLSFLSLILLVVGISAHALSEAAEFRFWQGVTSDQQLEARFEKFEDGHAFLRTRGDRLVRVAPSELSSHDLDYLKILAQGGNPAMLPARENAPARDVNAGYRIEKVPTQDVEATMTMKVTAPSLVAKEWVFFSARPPMVDAQEATVSLRPGWMTIRESGPRGRELMRARIPAMRSDLEKSAEVTTKVNARLYSRTLVKTGEPATGVVPLAPSTRRLFLTESRLMNHRSNGFQKWLIENQFHRTGNESQIDFARRVFLGIADQFAYTYSEQMDRVASSVCAAGESDCGGLSILFVSALRANGIPARLLVGRWAKSSTAGEKWHGVDYYQQHVKTEFYADGVGWIPVDVSLEVSHGREGGPHYFGNDPGDFVVLHFDHDIQVDTIHFGEKEMTWLQGINYWVTGSGNLDGSRIDFDWKVASTPLGQGLTLLP